MPQISVLMSVFNEKKEELDASIKSILSQTFKDFELIIINDNPQEKILSDTLAMYRKIDNRIKVYENSENIGLAESMNRAALKAVGKYLLRMDADDICDITRFEKQIKVISEGNYDLVCSSYYLMDEFGGVINKSVEWFDSVSLRKLLYYRNVIHHPTVIMKADSFNRVNGYRNFKCAQDYDLWLRMSEADFKFYMMQDKLIYYRVRTESTTVKNRYKQATTLDYIRDIHANKRKGKPDAYSYDGYLEYLTRKKANDVSISNDYLKNFEMYMEAKQHFKKLHFIKGLKVLLRVLLKSRYYRPNIRKVVVYSMIKKVLKLRYILIKDRKMNND